ncbi:hybrid sensor histidine kinase/response regulator [Oceanospirillum sediminis]|uniref:histidine kinase n=1 Tax=Oceanospirillum sediminis TaxID=2760088 RepID=A0A839IRT8_9GAMM|nr:response regulator [Oceanospirillum sediminis]MBB1487390.1 response regulator [Oceanospirillum sediminis]
MIKSNAFWVRITDSILWISLSGLFLLFPLMAYLLQPSSDVRQDVIFESIHDQKELINAMRREVALLSRGYRDNPGDNFLDLFNQYEVSVKEIDHELRSIIKEIPEVREQWKLYRGQQQAFQQLILDISSMTASFALLVSQTGQVFVSAEEQLKATGLSAMALQEYKILLSGILFHNLRYVALPDAAGAFELKNYLDKVDAGLKMSPGAVQSVFNAVKLHHLRLRDTVEDMQDASDVLLALPLYLELEEFENRFESWVRIARKNQNDSRWAMLAVISLLIVIVVIILWRLRVFRRRLEVSNIRLRAFKDAMDEHAIVSITDPKGRITYVNKKFEDISGFSAEELLGKTHKVINSGVHPGGFFGELWQSALSDKVWHGEVCNRAKSGKLYWVNATVVPIYDHKKRMVSIVSVRTDISDQKLIEKELLAERDKAKQASDAKSSFLANMSHEIRTPMNAIIGMSHLAKQVSVDDRVNSYIDKIQLSSQNLLSIINDILDFSKIEAGKMDVERIPFRLDNVLNNLADVARVKAEEKSLPLIFDIDGALPAYFEGDPLRLGQVLLNLVNNAIKFTDSGEIRISASLLRQTGNQAELRFSVQDSGIGLSQEAQQRLFKAFSQADASTTRQYGGTGLGLAICKQLVELMGGQINVFSESGKGSEFFFTIKADIHHLPEEEKPALDTIRVLIIDDESVAVEACVELLNSINIDAVGETNSPDGLNRLVNAELVGEAPFDVVLVDWQMPVMDGFQVAQSIRNNSSLTQQPAIILITGHGGEDLQQKINPEFIDAVLLKPVSGSHLADSIQECLIRQNRVRGSGNGSIRHMFREGDEINALLGAKILIAEDNLINQEVITGLLEPYGLDLTLVDNGRDAVNAVQQQQYDLIMMDIQMPQLDGLQATLQIHEMQLPKTPPIIAMTAHAMQEDIVQCMSHGMNDHIAKPIDPDLLKEKLIQWIEPRVISGELESENGAEKGSSLPCAVEGVDLAIAMRSVAGNAELLIRLMKQFCDDYSEGITPARQYMAQGEWSDLKRWLHTLKGTSSTLGMSLIAENVKIVELMLVNNKLPGDHDLTALAEVLSATVNSVITCINEKGFDNGQYKATAPDERLFMQSIQPMQSTNDPEKIKNLIQAIRVMLEEGDAEVLDKVPELMEQVQDNDTLMQHGVTLMELVESYEFDQALELLALFER